MRAAIGLFFSGSDNLDKFLRLFSVKNYERNKAADVTLTRVLLSAISVTSAYHRFLEKTLVILKYCVSWGLNALN